MRRVILATVGVLALAAVVVAQERDARFSVISAQFRATGDKGVLSIVVKNEGDLAGTATVTVRRELSWCAEEDTNWCLEHPAAPGETCVTPCKRYETRLLGVDEATTSSIDSCKEQTLEIIVPNEEAYAEIRVVPGGRLGFGVEIRPR